MLKMIRASSLPTYNDCALLAATSVKVDLGEAQMSLFEWADLQVPEKGRGRKAAVGTALHAVIEDILKDKLNSVEPDEEKALSAGLDKLEEEWALCEDDSEEEGSIKSIDSAEAYLINMSKVAIPRVLPLEPIAVEVSLSRRVKDDTITTGHPDAIIKTYGGRALIDWKTTNAMVAKAYTSQVGEYGNQIDDAGIYGTVQEAYTETFRRIKQKESTIITTPYDFNVVKQYADSTVNRFSANIDRFVATGDIHSFNANPSSNLCSPKYCPLWGNICKVGKGVNS